MIWTSGPAIVIAALGFAALGLVLTPAQTTFDTAQAQATLASEFNISLLNLLRQRLDALAREQERA